MHEYGKHIFLSKTLADLARPSKSMIRKVVELVLPEELVEFRPRVMPPPQENNEIDLLEERKGNEGFDLISHVSKECKIFVQAMKMVGLSLEADIQHL